MSFQTYSSRYNFFAKWRNVQLCMQINFITNFFMYCPWFSRNNSISGATSLKAHRKESLLLSTQKWKLKYPHLPSDRFIWLRINSSSTDVGENNAVTFEFVNALQWSFIGGLLAANASGIYHPNLKDILHVIITHFTS